jgi:arylsulfatase A-like enzyme
MKETEARCVVVSPNASIYDARIDPAGVHVNPLRQALASGLVLGAAWGALEALLVRMGPWMAFWGKLGDVPPLDGIDLMATVLLGAAHYGVIGAVGCTLAVLLLRRKRLGSHDESLLAPRLMVGCVLFVNLYWHTKQLWDFSWGLPFHHWKRLLLTLGWVLVAALSARLMVREGGLIRVPGRILTLVVVVILAVGGTWAMAREASLIAGPGGAPDDAPNVLLVVVDALRKDRLGCYGYDRDPPVSPNVDRLAKQGVVFDHAWVQAPFTWTSFGSFLTGKYPREHGLIKMWPDQKLDVSSNRTLAQALQEKGYATGAFLTGTLSNDTGLLHGFDTYFETIVGHEAVNRHSKWSVVRSRMLLWTLYNKTRQAVDRRLVNTEAQSWIREHADRPFFALVHYYATHTPYDPPPPYNELYDPGYAGLYFHPFRQKHGQWIMKQQQEGVCEHDGLPAWSCDHFDPVRDVAHINALYDGGVRFADEMFGSLLSLLDELGIAEETLVIFTSDHGEELFDHGLFEHDWMFETNLAVPLILRLPGNQYAGSRVPWPVEMRDLPATALDVADMGDMGAGRSLIPDAAGVDPGEWERTVIAENVRYVSLRDDQYKLTQNRFGLLSNDGDHSTRLFDLLADPNEHHPLDLSDPELAPIFRKLVERYMAHDAAMPAVRSVSSAGGGEEERALRMAKVLAELGYVSGMSPEAKKAAVAGSEKLLGLLSTSQFMGSNEILEEEIYERPFQWPPGFNGRPPEAVSPAPKAASAPDTAAHGDS